MPTPALEMGSVGPPDVPRDAWQVRALTTIVFALSVAASVFCAGGLSTPIAPDTSSYWATLAQLATPAPGGLPVRTPLYSLLIAVVHAIGGAGLVLLALQIGARGLACGLVAWHLARVRPLAGLLVGGLLALDPVSAGMSTGYLTESLYATGLLVSLAVAVGQLQNRRTLTRARVFAAGVLFGWAFLFRPNAMALIVPMVAAYWIATRSVAIAAWSLGGFSVVAAAVAVFNYLKYGLFTIVASGIYLAFPLFIHQLFDPGNGPASAAMHARLQECDPQVDYRKVISQNSNLYVHTRFTPCLAKGVPGESAGQFDIYRRAYLEAIRAHPGMFASRMLEEVAEFLASAAARYLEEMVRFSRSLEPSVACARQGAYAMYQPDLVSFVCPMPAVDEARLVRLEAVARWTRFVYQPYLVVGETDPWVAREDSARGTRVAAGVAGVVFFGAALAIASAPYRPWVAGALVVVLYSAAATAVGQVTLLRYVAVTCPFLLLVSGLTGLSAVERGLAYARRRPRPASPPWARLVGE
jgi:hypothetical protein